MKQNLKNFAGTVLVHYLDSRRNCLSGNGGFFLFGLLIWGMHVFFGCKVCWILKFRSLEFLTTCFSHTHLHKYMLMKTCIHYTCISWCENNNNINGKKYYCLNRKNLVLVYHECYKLVQTSETCINRTQVNISKIQKSIK